MIYPDFGKTLIRTDSSSQIGIGHIMRDLVLAERIGGNVTFACMPLKGAITKNIPYPVIEIQTNKPEELISLINTGSFDTLIIDHYQIDYHFEKQLKQATNVRVLSFDDTYEKHYCDILLNHNICCEKDKYIDLVPGFCEVWCGEQYMLLRKEFIEEKPKNRKKIYALSIILGGADTANLTLETLQNHSDRPAAIVTTSANAHLAELIDYCRHDNNIDIIIDSKNIAKILNQSKKAIITASSIAQEAIFLGVPFQAIQTAENQDGMRRYLEAKGYDIL